MLSCFSSGCGGRHRTSPEALTMILLGLDNAGKTTVTAAMKGSVITEASPTWGLNHNKLVVGKQAVNLYDVGGGPRIRGIWKRYLPEVHGIIIVVDSSDLVNLREANRVIAEHMAEKHAQGKPIVLLANKQDVPGALLPREVGHLMGIAQSDNALVMGCTATGVKGRPDPAVSKALRWLVSAASRDQPLMQRVSTEAKAQMDLEKRRREQRKQRLHRNTETDGDVETQPVMQQETSRHNGKSEQEAGTARTREQASVGEAEGAGGQGGAAPGETRKAEAWCSGGGKRVAAEGDSGGAHEEGVSRSEGGCQGSSEGAELLAEGAPRESGRPPMGERRTPSTPRGSGAGDGSESGRVGGGWSGMGASTQAALDGLIEGVVAGRVDSEQEGTQTAERRPAGVSLGYQSCPAQTAGTTGRGAEGMARKDAEKRAQLMAAAQNGTDQVALMRLLADDARKVATMQQMQRTVPEIEPQPGSPGMREVSESAHPC